MTKKAEEVVPVLLGIFIFLNPFPHTTAVKEFCYYSAVALALILWVTGRRVIVYKTPLTIPLGLFVFWAFLGIFFALDKSNSLHDFRAHLLKYFILYFMIVTYYNTRVRLKALAWIVIVSGVLFSIYGLMWHYFVLDYGFSDRFGQDLFSEIPLNLIGVTTIFCIILALNKFFLEEHLWRKAGAAVCVFPPLIVTIMTQSKATWIAILVSLVVLLFKRKIVLTICVFTILVVIFGSPLKQRIFEESSVKLSFKLRLKAALIALEIVKDYPVIGIGYGMKTYGQSLDLSAYRKRIPEVYRGGENWEDPHNMVSSVVVRLGIVGFGIFLYMAYRLLIMCWITACRGKDKFIVNWGFCGAAVLIAYGIIGLCEPIFSHVHEVVLCTLVAMISIVMSLHNQIDNKAET